MPRSRMLPTALVTALAVLAFGGSSMAARLSVSETRFRATYANELFFRSSEGVNITCEATLEGSFTRATFAKTAGAAIAAVTRVSTNFFCPMSFLAAVPPWTITYSSFAGALPNITWVDTTVSPFSFRWSGNGCLYTATAGVQEPLRLLRNTTGRHIEIAGLLGGVSLPSAACGLGMFVSGNGRFLSAGGALVTMTLI